MYRVPILLVAMAPAFASPPLPAADHPVFQPVACEGSYRYHLQGVCTDKNESIYWSFTDALVKTSAAGKVQKKIPVGNHHGDLCHHDGKVYVAVNFGRFNDAQKRADSWVYVYDADDLSLLAKHKTPELVFGAGGIAQHDGRFIVVGGLPGGFKENYAYEYDATFKFIKRHVIPSGHTDVGIQTAEFADGHWWFGCYGSPKILLKVDEKFGTVKRFEFDCSLGIVRIARNQFLVARGSCSKDKGCNGQLLQAEPDEMKGLRIRPHNAISFKKRDDRLQIAIAGKQFAEYVTKDEKIRRPFFRHLHSPSGIQITRESPPAKENSLADHATMHPGLWMAFGDISGTDFWRNKGLVRHVEFSRQPAVEGDVATFAVRNSYEAGEKQLCTEECEIRIALKSRGTLLDWTSTFTPTTDDIYFGDQEEMGLGVRVATPLAVVKGGEIRDSEGRKNGKEVWGKKADWCEYTGSIQGKRVGIVLMPDPKNFRRSWFHARDYGLLLANPFGRNAFTKGEKSRIEVKAGETLRLRYGIFIYDETSEEPADIIAIYREFAGVAERPAE